MTKHLSHIHSTKTGGGKVPTGSVPDHPQPPTDRSAVTGVATPVFLLEDGVLWALNTCVLHPRGFALQIDVETGKLWLIGDGGEVWVFDEATAIEARERFEQLLQRQKAHAWLQGPRDG